MHLDNIHTEKYELEIYECDQCGGHIGFDSSFIEQNEEIDNFLCPYCQEKIEIAE